MADEETSPPPPESTLTHDPMEEMPILTVRDTVIFPGAMLPITVGRPSSVALVNSLGENRLLAVVSQLDPRIDTPRPDDLYQVGTVCVMHKAIRVPKDNLLLFCEGLGRLRTTEFTTTEPFLKARIERISDVEPEITPEIVALRQNVVSLFQQIVTASPNLSDDLSSTAEGITAPGALADFVGGNLPSLSPTERQKLLEQPDGRARLNEIHVQLTRELELVELRGRIQSAVQGQLSQNQREFYLREQLKAIQKELGETDEASRDVDDLRQKLEAAGLPEEVQDRGHAGIEPPLAHLAQFARVRRFAHVPGVDGGAAVEHLVGLAGRRETRRGDPRRGSLRSRKGEGAHSRLPRRAATQARAQRTHPVLRGTSGSGQDFARQVDRARAWPQVRARLHGRHA